MEVVVISAVTAIFLTWATAFYLQVNSLNTNDVGANTWTWVLFFVLKTVKYTLTYIWTLFGRCDNAWWIVTIVRKFLRLWVVKIIWVHFYLIDDISCVFVMEVHRDSDHDGNTTFKHNDYPNGLVVSLPHSILNIIENYAIDDWSYGDSERLDWANHRDCGSKLFLGNREPNKFLNSNRDNCISASNQY